MIQLHRLVSIPLPTSDITHCVSEKLFGSPPRFVTWAEKSWVLKKKKNSEDPPFLGFQKNVGLFSIKFPSDLKKKKNWLGTINAVIFRFPARKATNFV